MSTEAMPLGDVLSVTTGRLVSRDGIGGVYRVCDHMTGTPNFTHQLPRVCDEIRPVIFEQAPWLGRIVVPDFPETATAEDWMTWLGQMELTHGATVALAPLAAYSAPNPIEELCDMVGPEKVYVFPASAPVGEAGES